MKKDLRICNAILFKIFYNEPQEQRKQENNKTLTSVSEWKTIWSKK